MHAIRWGTLLLTFVAIVAVGAALILSLHPTEVLKHENEWVKALLQAGLIAVLGVVTSAVLETFKDSLQRPRDQSKIRFDVLGDIARIYMDLKLVRLRFHVATSIASDDISELNDSQVRLELHKYNSVSIFKGDAALKEALDKMEKYLNRVANKSESDERLRFCDRDGFKVFASAFHEAIIIMQQDIATPDHRFLG